MMDGGDLEGEFIPFPFRSDFYCAGKPDPAVHRIRFAVRNLEKLQCDVRLPVALEPYGECIRPVFFRKRKFGREELHGITLRVREFQRTAAVNFVLPIPFRQKGFCIELVCRNFDQSRIAEFAELKT